MQRSVGVPLAPGWCCRTPAHQSSDGTVATSGIERLLLRRRPTAAAGRPSARTPCMPRPGPLTVGAAGTNPIVHLSAAVTRVQVSPSRDPPSASEAERAASSPPALAMRRRPSSCWNSEPLVLHSASMMSATPSASPSGSSASWRRAVRPAPSTGGRREVAAHSIGRTANRSRSHDART